MGVQSLARMRHLSPSTERDDSLREHRFPHRYTSFGLDQVSHASLDGGSDVEGGSGDSSA